MKVAFATLLLAMAMPALTVTPTVALAADESDTKPGVGAGQPGGLAAADWEFFQKAGASGLAEVETGKLAEQRAANPRVVEFARMMVKDHTAANDKLKALASRKGVTLPAAPEADAMKAMEKLQDKKEEQFDEAYMDKMVADHKKSVELFEGRAKDSGDADIRGFASQTLPTLKHHLKMAEELADSTDERG